MSEEREKVRCQQCELVQWRDRTTCRRCGQVLPEPVVKIVERVVERVVIRQDPQCLENLEQARLLIEAASDRLTAQCTEVAAPIVLAHVSKSSSFPTMAEMERAMILAAYQRSNRKPLEAARLLGIGKTTLYRKLKGMSQAAA
jgi:transcriptional regulator of acetoin/glycerol metabolism